jgi:pilus assembly protein CpaC
MEGRRPAAQAAGATNPNAPQTPAQPQAQPAVPAPVPTPAPTEGSAAPAALLPRDTQADRPAPSAAVPPPDKTAASAAQAQSNAEPALAKADAASRGNPTIKAIQPNP